MKNLVLLIILLLLVNTTFGRNTPQRNKGRFFTENEDLHQQQKKASLLILKRQVLDSSESDYDNAWKGWLGKNIPIFLHYHQLSDSNLLEGEITYLNTKTKTPIALTGNIQKSGEVHLVEYDAKGYVSGVIYAKIKAGVLTGKWHKPGSKDLETYPLKLQKSDSLISSENSSVDPRNIFGKYHYQYGKRGYEGDLEIKKINEYQAILSMFSVTNAPARNIADGVTNDTIPLPTKTGFIHKVDDQGNCKVELRFFKNFVQVNYPEEADCELSFGMNATYEGTYYKIRTE